MSANPTDIQQKPAQRTLKHMQVVIRGKLLSSVVREGRRYSVVATPAADEYSHPQVVEIRSDRVQQLGEVNEQVTCTATLGGWKRQFDYTDRDGRASKGQQITHTLDLVE